MTTVKPKTLRCAVYTRVSTDAGLEQDFNSLDAQREACEAYVKSQTHEGWRLIKTQFDDGGFSGGNMDRPALQSLLTKIRECQLDIIVVYKVDRRARSRTLRNWSSCSMHAVSPSSPSRSRSTPRHRWGV